MNKIKLTIAVPTYNNQDNLRRAIDSCKHITLKEDQYEILVVDNCSTDGTIDLIKSLKKKIKTIRFVQNKKNLGRIGNWNKCITKAKGKYFLYLFSNDIISKKNNISKMIKYLDNNPCVGLVLSRYEESYNGNITIKRDFIKRNLAVDSKKFVHEHMSLYHLHFGPPQSNIYRRAKLKYAMFIESLPFVSDQIQAANFALLYKKVYLNKNPVFTWISTENRFHFQMDFSKYFKEEVSIIDHINIRINQSFFYQKAYLNIIYALIIRKIDYKSFRSLVKFLNNQKRKKNVKFKVSFLKPLLREYILRKK